MPCLHTMKKFQIFHFLANSQFCGKVRKSRVPHGLSRALTGSLRLIDSVQRIIAWHETAATYAVCIHHVLPTLIQPAAASRVGMLPTSRLQQIVQGAPHSPVTRTLVLNTSFAQCVCKCVWCACTCMCTFTFVHICTISTYTHTHTDRTDMQTWRAIIMAEHSISGTHSAHTCSTETKIQTQSAHLPGLHSSPLDTACRFRRQAMQERIFSRICCSHFRACTCCRTPT